MALARKIAIKRGSAVCKTGAWDAAAAVDVIVLDADDRHRRRIVLTGRGGTRFLLDLDEAVALRDGDGIVLDDGAMVLVSGQPEPLAEAVAPTAPDLMRLAWHLGNRHADVQIAGERLRFRRDHVLEELAKGLGASVAPIMASFDPENATPVMLSRKDNHGP